MATSPLTPSQKISEVIKPPMPPSVSALTSKSEMTSSLQAQLKALQTERQQEREDQCKELEEINKALKQQQVQNQQFMTQLLDVIGDEPSTEIPINQNETVANATNSKMGDHRHPQVHPNQCYQ